MRKIEAITIILTITILFFISPILHTVSVYSQDSKRENLLSESQYLDSSTSTNQSNNSESHSNSSTQSDARSIGSVINESDIQTGRVVRMPLFGPENNSQDPNYGIVKGIAFHLTDEKLYILIKNASFSIPFGAPTSVHEISSRGSDFISVIDPDKREVITNITLFTEDPEFGSKSNFYRSKDLRINDIEFNNITKKMYIAAQTQDYPEHESFIYAIGEGDISIDNKYDENKILIGKRMIAKNIAHNQVTGNIYTYINNETDINTQSQKSNDAVYIIDPDKREVNTTFSLIDFSQDYGKIVFNQVSNRLYLLDSLFNKLYYVNMSDSEPSEVEIEEPIAVSVDQGYVYVLSAGRPFTDKICTPYFPYFTWDFLGFNCEPLSPPLPEKPESVAIIKTSNHSVIANIPIGPYNPSDSSALAFNERDNKIYVAINEAYTNNLSSNAANSSLIVIDASRNNIVKSIPISKLYGESYIAVDPHDDKLFIVSEGGRTADIVDISSNDVSNT